MTAEKKENRTENSKSGLNEIFEFLDEKFLDEYDNIEAPSNLPDGTYHVVVTKSEVLPVTRSAGKTISLKFSAKVLTPEDTAGKIFGYDFTLNENNKGIMKRMFFAMGFKFNLRDQLAAFTHLPGTEIEISISTNGQYHNRNIRRIVQKGEVLTNFLSNMSMPSEI